MTITNKSKKQRTISFIKNLEKETRISLIIYGIYYLFIIIVFILTSFMPLAKIESANYTIHIHFNSFWVTIRNGVGKIASGKLTPASGFSFLTYPLILIAIIGNVLTQVVLIPKEVISNKTRYIRIIYKIFSFLYFLTSLLGFFGLMFFLNYVHFFGENSKITILFFILLVIFVINTIYGFFIFYESLSVDLSEEIKGRKNSNVLNIIRYESKRVIFTLKFFVALSLILLPAIIYLNSIAQDYEALLLDFGEESFKSFSAAGFVIIAQFLIQMIAIMLTLDSFGEVTKESKKRYFSLPVYRIDIYFSHVINIVIGLAISSILAIFVYDFILWVWTSISLSFILILKCLFLVLIGSFLAISITTFFIMIGHVFNFTSSIAIIPTLFLFYIIPFLVNFISQFVYGLPEANKWTYMYQLAIITDFLIEPQNGLQEIVEPIAERNAWLIIIFSIFGTQSISGVLFTQSEN
ncbi:MAG: hypothetical protein FK730_06615 [Asgard group archaeon]|nr:hypothetical protein [Asgard group archaeon]